MTETLLSSVTLVKMLKLCHNSVRRPLLTSLVAFLLVGSWVGSRAYGEVVTITETGTVTALKDSLGVFGSPGGNLAGDAITNVYTFDLAVIPPISGSLGADNSYQMLLAEGGLLSSVTTTIGGQPLAIYGNSSASDFSLQPNPATGDYPNGSLLTLTAQGFDQVFNPSGFSGNMIFLDDQLYSLQSPILASLTAPTFLPVNTLDSGVFGSGEIGITGYAYDGSVARYTGGAEFGTFSASSIEVDVSDGVQITGGSGDGPIGPSPAVPEPATWALMLIGFLGLGSALRARRASDSAALA